VLPERPAGPQLAAVARLEGVCEPSDIIANRLLAAWGVSGHTLHTVPVQGRSPVLRKLAEKGVRAR
jgi:isorenieratene synthase